MTTSGTFTFKDNFKSFQVFVHLDCYPTGAAVNLKTTLDSGKIWDLPRFEANEFAAGFVTSVKTQGGNVRLLQTDETGNHAYDYTIFMVSNVLQLSVSSGNPNNVLFIGPLAEFIESGAALIEE